MTNVIKLHESEGEQQDVFDDALLIFKDRNEKYRDTWKQYGALANLVRSAQKVDRLMAVWWFEDAESRPPLTKEDLDDAYDVINHMAFFIRCVKAGDLLGEISVRPREEITPDDVVGRDKTIGQDDCPARPDGNDHVWSTWKTGVQRCLYCSIEAF